MNVDVSTLLEETIERMATGAGALLVVLFTILGAAKALALVEFGIAALEWAVAAYGDSDPEAAADLERALESATAEGLGFGLGMGPAVLLWIVAFVASLAVLAVAIDAFAREVDEPGALGTGRIGWQTANLVAGWILYTILVLIGAVFFLLPGAIVAIVLLFYPVAIVVDDEWVGAAFASSIGVFQDNFGEALVVSAIAIGAYLLKRTVSGVLIQLGGPSGQLVAELVGAIYWVFLFALLTRTYVALSSAGAPDVIGDDADAAGRQPA